MRAACWLLLLAAHNPTYAAGPLELLWVRPAAVGARGGCQFAVLAFDFLFAPAPEATTASPLPLRPYVIDVNELPGFADKTPAGPAVAAAADGFVSDLFNFLIAELERKEEEEEGSREEVPQERWGFQRLAIG